MVVVTAPLPGKIISLKVAAGDSVTKDQALFVMEALKMENTIVAPADGTVKAVHVRDGDDVETGAEVLEIE